MTSPRPDLEETSKRVIGGSSPPADVKPARNGKPGQVLAIVCPGQGSQTPGFLTPWLDVPGLADRLARYADVTGLDLVAHGTTSDAETIRDTAVAQPLIVAAGLLGLAALAGEDGPEAALPAGVGVVAGHSVGEITAAAATGVLSETQSLIFVRERGRAMAAASAVTPTGMSAVLGGDPDEVAGVLDEHGLTPANVNGGGQVVAAGTLEQLAALAADPPAKARVIPLQVAGAFHTTHMAPAVQTLSALAAGFTPADPVGDPAVERGRRRGRRRRAGPGPPGLPGEQPGPLGPVHADAGGSRRHRASSSYRRRAPSPAWPSEPSRESQIVALKTPDDLDTARALVAEHAGTADAAGPASPSAPTSTPGGTA